MDILYVAFLSIFSIIALFILTKIIGNHQMSQLNMFEYINGITIGSIAAEMAISSDKDFLKPLTAMIIYSLITAAIGIITNKSIVCRRFIEGRAILLFDNGKLFKKNFKRTKLDINEFLMQCRMNGYFNLSDIQTVILEPNGQVSILPKSDARPVTLNDLSIKTKQEKIIPNIILDGQIMLENLKQTGNNIDWLQQELKKQNTKLKEVFLGVCDNNSLVIFKQISDKPENDIFQ